MENHRYSLEKYVGRASRHECPRCGAKGRFTLYIDNDTGTPLGREVGRCERQDSCGYHYTPSEWFRANPNTIPDRNYQSHQAVARIQPKPPREVGQIPRELLIKSLGYKSNFVVFLCSLFDRNTVESPTIVSIMKMYYLGQAKGGRVVFWRIDGNKRIRAGKIMQYDPVTGKRVKNVVGAIDWVHSTLKRKRLLPDDFNSKPCLFGEHLLQQRPNAIVCIVESEKSAIISSVVMPEYIWLATGGKDGLKADTCQCLQGRNVIVHPDLKAFEQWRVKAVKIASEVGFVVQVSEMLERIATPEQVEAGYDIADYLISELQNNPMPAKQIEQPRQVFSPLELLADANPQLLSFIEQLDLSVVQSYPYQKMAI